MDSQRIKYLRLWIIQSKNLTIDDSSLTRRYVLEVMNRLSKFSCLSVSIAADNGPKFAGNLIQEWTFSINIH